MSVVSSNAPEARPLRVLIVAGEVSGDMHAAAVMRAMRARHDAPILFRGIGGDDMAAEGAEILFHTDHTAMVGFWEVFKRFGFVLEMMRRMKQELRDWQPDLVLTVDYPGFNIRFAEVAHKQGFRTCHYICPKVWVWNKARIPQMAKCLDRLVTIFPFEAALFKGTGLPVTFAGHPLVDRAAASWAEPEPELPWKGRHHIALLPGSRTSEITRLLPDMLHAAALLEEELGEPCSFLIPAPTAKMRTLGEAVAARCARKPASFVFVDRQARQVMRQAHAAAVASGTATLEASLMRCPTVLIYRVSWLTYIPARFIIRGVKHLGLVNIIAGRTVMPELIQHDLSPAALAGWLKKYLTDAAARNQALAEYDAVNASLGSGQTAERAAEAVLATLKAE